MTYETEITPFAANECEQSPIPRQPQHLSDAVMAVMEEGGGPFFAPAQTSIFDVLLAQYRQERQAIERLNGMLSDPGSERAISHFLSGNANEERDRSRTRIHMSVGALFALDGALASLNASYWSKALAQTDVLDVMPQAKRSEWHELIRSMKCPDFEEGSVRSTILDLLASRSKFFAERIDGIFRSLSGTHVTNEPQGFGKRMIMAGMLDSMGYVNSNRSGVINDLRCVIARFMGREEPKHLASQPLIESLRARWGEWVSVDGGALRVRLYRKGTAHLEVHPDMAWRLNGVLASLYPLAIPAQFRTAPRRRPKDIALIQRPLPFAVLEVLACAEEGRVLAPQTNGWRETRLVRQPNSVQLPYGADLDTPSGREAIAILESLGGVRQGKQRLWQFDCDMVAVVRDIVVTGCLPDKVTHQFYPTQGELARLCADLVLEGSNEQTTFLEPSAGLGGLACLLPVAQTTCVEISELHCAVLRAKGYAAEQADFLEWSRTKLQMFSRVLMNPPFSDGRAQAHLLHAADTVRSGGRLVAILPASMNGKVTLPGFNVSWAGVFDNAFSNTSVSVCVLVADRH